MAALTNPQTWYCHNDGTLVTVDASQPPPTACPTCGQGSFATEPTSKAFIPGTTSHYPATGRFGPGSSGSGKHA